jgi:hypothetical protein
MTPLSLEYCRRVREHLNLHNQQVVEGPATLGNMLVETEPHAKPRTTAPPLRGGLGPAIREIDSHGRAALRRMQRCWTGCATRRRSGASPTTLVIRSIFREAEASFRQLEPSGPRVR